MADDQGGGGGQAVNKRTKIFGAFGAGDVCMHAHEKRCFEQNAHIPGTGIYLSQNAPKS